MAASLIPKKTNILGFQSDYVSNIPLKDISTLESNYGVNKISFYEREKRRAKTFQLDDELVPCVINATQLYFMSETHIDQLSVCNVDQPNKMGRGSPNDKRLGCTSDDELCETCHKTNMECPGHLGSIKLNYWYFNPLIARAGFYILQCVCNSCGGLLIDKETAQKQGLLSLSGMVRLKKMAEICTKLSCTKRYGSNNQNDSDQQFQNYIKTCCSEAPRKAKICEEIQGPCQKEIHQYKKCAKNPNYFYCKDTYHVAYSTSSDKISAKDCKDVDSISGKLSSRKMSEIDLIFNSISVEDALILGFNGESHPRNLIIKKLAVIPLQARPNLIQNGESELDPLTECYISIVRENNKLLEYNSKNGSNFEQKRLDSIRALWFYISKLMDNSDGSYSRKESSNEPHQMAKQRLQKKDGYIRGFTMGKRNDYSGRSVLGPNPKCPFGYVTWPERMRKVLTTPETVTVHNYSRMIELFEKGRITHITRGSGEGKNLWKGVRENTPPPNIGDVVDRWGEDGDECLFNRQPSLHKYSIMGYKSMFWSKEIVGLHSSNTTPHNADFDGDEGNQFKIQTTMARAETRHVSNVESCIMSTQANRPIMGLVFNCIPSVFKLTDDKTFIKDYEWVMAIANLIRDDETSRRLASLERRLKKWNIPMFSGKAVFSMLLPEDFYYNGKGNLEDDIGIEIRDGVLRQGVLGKKHIGPVGGSIIQQLWKQYGQEFTSRFFTEGQFMLDWFIERAGLSVGYSSCVTSEKNTLEIRKIVDNGIVKANLEIESLGNISDEMSQIEKDYHERQIETVLRNLTNYCRSIGLKTLRKNNPFNIMANSGAKGGDLNTSQILGIIGQQFVKEKRVALTISNGTRAWPWYLENDPDIRSRGFISESFITGMKLGGFASHLCAARVGLIDSAVKTADVGHLHHKLNKTLEDIVQTYDGSVRNLGGTIFQFSFSDGFSASELINTKSVPFGDIVSFIDLDATIGKINLSYGYDFF